MVKNPSRVRVCVRSQGRSLLKYGGPGMLKIVFSKEVKEMKDQVMKTLEQACSRKREQQVQRF